MAWRLHLSNQAIHHLDILSGKQSLLAAWIRQDRVAYFDLLTGTALQEQTITFTRPDDPESPDWDQFIQSLVAPNGLYLPVVNTGKATIYTSDDGQLRVYHRGDVSLAVETYGDEVPLDVQQATTFLAVDLDRFLGMIAALDEQGRLHIYQQTILVGVFDLGLSVDEDSRPSVAMSQGAQAIFVSDGQQIVRADSSGQVVQRLQTHYAVGLLAVSPDGERVATGDTETGVIRVYDGSDLTPTHQRFGIDLLTKARQVQLLADLPPAGIALNTLAIDNQGHLAFAMSGVICVTELDQMDQLPRPQFLF